MSDRPLGVGDYPTLSSRRIFEGRVIALRSDEVRMSDGSVSAREIVEHPGAVGIVALDAEDRVVLVNQYRHPVRAYLEELPAGLLDVDGESALDAARRELFEEAALVANRWDVLLDLHPSPGMSDEAIRIFLARELHEPPGSRYEPEGEEITMTVTRVPLDLAVRRALAGEITNSAAVAGLLAAAVAGAAGWQSVRPAEAPWSARPGR